MHAPYVSTRTALSRRHLITSFGATAIALPLLDAMSPAFATAGTVRKEAPKRFVAMCAGLGFHCPHLFPEKPGVDYELTPYLSQLKDHRDHLTVISGLSHPNQQGNNGHASELTWLTSAQRPGLTGFRNTISLDQLIAEKIGIETRYPYLALSTSGRSLSWTSTGVEIPGETSPGKLFKSLFMDGTPREIAQQTRQLQKGRSILDTVLGEAKQLDHELGRRDRQKLSEYLTAVRDLESRLQQSQGWAKRPKPDVDAEQPQDISDKTDAIGRQRLMYDMIVLALQTDSTRTVTFQLSGMNAVPKIQGVSHDWHNLSHHGKDPEKIEELKLIEEAEFETFNEFLTKLNGVAEDGNTLLDSTSVLFGSNLGNASSHNWKNLPLILAGGQFRHGSYIAHDESSNTPLANLYVSIAQQMGLEMDQFGSSTQAGIAGLETG